MKRKPTGQKKPFKENNISKNDATSKDPRKWQDVINVLMPEQDISVDMSIEVLEQKVLSMYKVKFAEDIHKYEQKLEANKDEWGDVCKEDLGKRLKSMNKNLEGVSNLKKYITENIRFFDSMMYYFSWAYKVASHEMKKSQKITEEFLEKYKKFNEQVAKL